MTDFIDDFFPEIDFSAPIIIIYGPTASGKSELAVKIAQKSKAVIINADSCQIYHDARILTARPSQMEMSQVPHLLYGFLPLSSEYSTYDWCQDVIAEIQDAHAKNLSAVIVGGTGLYIHTLINGIAEIPAIDPDIRNQIRSMPTSEIYSHLQQEDPVSAQKFHPNDTQRLARALEVIRSTGHPLTYWHENNRKFLPDHISPKLYAIMPERDLLYKRINERFDNMIKKGAIDEAKNIIQSGAGTIKHAKKIVGLSELIDFHFGKLSLEDAISEGKKASRRYAKRQLTWMRSKFNF
ncbi:MAG: tRNA (adenosine(37)-N6)-dimethylallyltransferase MiaA [Pseudomonadota bacterium]